MKIKEFLSKFYDWFRGFFSIEYTVELPDKPVLTGEALFETLSINNLFYNNLMAGYTPIRKCNIGIKNYSITQVDIDFISTYIKRVEQSLHYSRIDTIKFNEYNYHEINLYTTIFSIGLDNKLWKFEFETYFVYNSSVSELNSQIIDLCRDIISALIDKLNLNTMCIYNINPKLIRNWKIGDDITYESNIRTVSNNVFFGVTPSFEKIDGKKVNFDIKDTISDEYLNFESEIVENDDNDMIVQVIRK